MRAVEKPLFPIPRKIEEIDREWLTAALRVNAPDVTVLDFRILDVFNATSTSIRLLLTLDDEGRRAGIPDYVYLKGGFQEHSQKLASMHKLETLGYRDLLVGGELNSPICYFADWDEENDHGVIIMEDLTQRGGKFGHLRVTRSPEEVEAGVVRLAHYHARTWDCPTFAPEHPLGWVRQQPILETPGYQHGLSPEGFEEFATLPRAGATSTYFKDREWMIEAVRRIGILSKRVPNCIHHGDPNPGNIFFQDDGNVAFFDIVPRRGPALFEVAYHVTLSLDPIDRPKHEENLVRRYLGELRQLGVNPPSFEDAMFQYGVFLAEAMLMCFFNLPGVIPEDMAVIPVARLTAAMIDHDTRGLIARIR